MNIWHDERIRLRAVEPQDATFFYEWNHDSEMARMVDHVWFPLSHFGAQRWAERVAQQEPQNDIYQFIIETLMGEPVGAINSHSCDRRVGVFMYGVAIRSDYQRQGYATAAIRLLLRYFFEELNYQKVMADVYSCNEASLHLHERLGFQLEGRLRRMVFTQGQYFDKLVYGMTIEEYRAAGVSQGLPLA